MNSSNRVILNTGFLYVNMIVTMCVQLVSVRILFNAFGQVDYGIYNVVAGIVAFFAFMNVAMAAATQRFLSYAIGTGDRERLKELFYQSLILHLFIGFVFLLLLETGGLYYVHHILKAPATRIMSATLLLHCIAASTFVNIITVPYEADINANEDMGAIAAINILDSLMKLGIAFIVYYTMKDRLILFGVLTMTCLMITLMLKRTYCYVRYEESHIRWHRIYDFAQMREVASFASWNLIGSGCGIARYQGTALILNYFFGIVVNAAYGVAQQVNALLNFFANTIVRAIRPQVVKSEGEGNRARMLRLSETTCKVTSLMVAFMAIPLFVVMPYILTLWLGHHPGADCVIFCRSFLCIVFINQLTIGLQVAIESVGRIRLLQTTVGFMHLAALPLGWFCFRMRLPAATIMYCIIGEELVALFVRSFIARHQTGLSARHFLLSNTLPCMSAVGVVLILSLLLGRVLGADGMIPLFLITLFSITTLALVSYFLLLNNRERKTIRMFIEIAWAKLAGKGGRR